MWHVAHSLSGLCLRGCAGAAGLVLAATCIIPATAFAREGGNVRCGAPAVAPLARGSRIADALLGGQPSRLNQVSARQAPEPSAGPQIVVSASAHRSLGERLSIWARYLAPNLAPVAPTMSYGPMSYGIVSYSMVSYDTAHAIVPEALRLFVRDVPAAPHDEPMDCNGRIVDRMAPPIPAARVVPALLTGAMPTGPVDFFGSSALPISHTPLDRKWAGVAAALPRDGAWRTLVAAGRGLAPRQQVDAVNRWVNGRLRFVDDIRAAGVADQWSTAASSLSRGTGDCEDYAIAKMRLLEAMGFDRRALFLVVARDLVRRADHAVLVARVDGQAVVLDNMTDRLVSAMAASDYRPIITLGAAGRWTHGYRVAGAVPAEGRRFAALR